MSECRIFFFEQKTAYEVSACLVGSEMVIRDSLCCELASAAAPHFGEYRNQYCIRESFHRGGSIEAVLLLGDLHSRQMLCSSLA